MDKKVVGEASIDTRFLYQRLAQMSVGETITYKELNDIIGSDVQGQARSALTSARKICERENNKTFGVIYNEGLKCLADEEIVNTSVAAVEHIRRTSRRTIRRLGCVQNFNALENDDKVRFNTYTSILGVMATMTKSNNIKKIEAKVQETQEQLPYTKALEAFK